MLDTKRTKSGIGAAVLIGAAILFCSSIRILAQTTTGGLRGAITDASGAALPGARVTARNMATGFETKTTATGEGVYS
ncbi:MAG: carboxypeptidase regulatory-like domain-containing protein, partial [Chloracidobacterium sp.]|nr:carboxypeptidase regulatory-like domain-containing protein [Chloracidobacterium sp.]